MKHYKQKLSNNNQGGGATTKNKIKIDDKEIIDINKSIDWKKEREYLFSKIKTLEKEVNSLKTKNQELQIQLTLTQSSIESKKSSVVTDENLKEPHKRRVDHKRIYSEMFTSYRKKKLKQNSDDARSGGIGVLKQLIKQKPRSFGECTNEIIGNKILSNIIKEFRKDLKEQKKYLHVYKGDRERAVDEWKIYIQPNQAAIYTEKDPSMDKYFLSYNAMERCFQFNDYITKNVRKDDEIQLIEYRNYYYILHGTQYIGRLSNNSDIVRK